METAGQRATYEDLLLAPDNAIAEIVDGHLHLSPRPAPRHSLVATTLTGQLYEPFHTGRGGPGNWVFLIEPELHLGSDPDILVPDLAGWRRDHMLTLPEAAYITLAPDWVCEVASPSTRWLDRKRKMPIYAREKVGHLWLVDPASQTLEVFRLGEDWTPVATYVGDAGPSRVEPFEAIAFDLSRLWHM